jgi:hypothetical protein
MALDPKYEDCRRNKHRPDTDVVVEQNGIHLILQSVCEVCGAMLDTEVDGDSWNAVYDSDVFCNTCGEAPPHCECN